ncbi:ankyrin repeat-containing domain protein [Trichoderma ceciliae]
MNHQNAISSNSFGPGARLHQGNVINHHYDNSSSEPLQRQGENETLSSLYKSPYQDRKNRNPPRVSGTCEWFISHEHFQTWNESNSSSMLWVSADPGCGKSVLARHLIDSILQTTESRTVCYFFFKDDFPDQKSVVCAICCILRQIFLQKPSLLSDAILEKFKAGGETFNASFSELWQILIQVAENENAGEIVCLLDAIDECEDQGGQGRSKLIQALCTLYGTRRGFNLKFLLTSRPYVEIHRGLQPLEIPGLPVIHLSGESDDEMKKISQEINIYIQARVDDISKRRQLTQSERELLLQKVMLVPNRTYLWVYVTLDLVENSIIDKMMIIEATSCIPTTVDEAYEKILSKSHNTKQTKKILHIIVAAARPLTIKEMSLALIIEDRHQSYNDLDLSLDDRFRQKLRDTCGLSVMIVDSKIYLLHQTVKEFLVKKDTMQTSRDNSRDYKWKHSLQPQESHGVLAAICTRHLLNELKLEPESPSRHTWHNFLDYSAKHWASHFREMPFEAQSIMTESILKICDVDSSCCQTWFRIYWTTTDTELPQGFTIIMIASYFGLEIVVRDLLTMDDIDLNARDNTYKRSALSWAARNDFNAVSELLIKGFHPKLAGFKLPFRKRANVDLADVYGRTPISYAVWNRNATLVKLLLKAGARSRSKDELGGTPLSYAFCNQHDEIINLLLKQRRGTDAEDDINSLLLSAAKKGDEEVIRLLLKTGRANIEVQGAWGQTALINAAIFGHQAVVKVLLEAGADLSLKDEDGQTALMRAASRGNKAVVKVLLEAGADLSIKDKDGQTALMYAARWGNKAAVRMLRKELK